ncbi:MAG: S8 family serine peptidase [Clostridia bacterium]|nr:S8 family serine peptidase [Clostridia bacterium]
MRKSGVSTKYVVLMLALAFVFCFALLALPMSLPEKTKQTYAYDEYYNDYMDMIKKYNSSNDGVFVASYVDDEETFSTRLIVYSDEDVEEYGAVASCAYNNTHILQYKDFDSADDAYEKYANSGLEVYYDEKVTIESFNLSTLSSTYNSWGWDASTDYTGINSYLNTLSMRYDSSQYHTTVVAVLDSGINTRHNDLKDRILYSCARDYTNETTSTAYAFEDTNGHGTHVSGIIAEATKSVADNVWILPLKCLGYNGEGSVTSIISAINYAVALSRGKDTSASLPEGYDLRVMNMSLGLTSKSGVNYLKTPIEDAYSYGITSVVAAGNEHKDITNCQPANVKKAITVTALRTYGGKLLFDASYSNFGEVDFAAPGTYILSDWIQDADHSDATIAKNVESGTSMATPHVSACVALLYINPENATATPEQIFDILSEKADRTNLYNSGTYAMGSATWNKYYGYGCINIARCAMKIEGKVSFSQSNRFQDNSFSLSLSYDTDTTGTVRIYYTTTDGEISTLYTGSLTITKTTRIKAMAYVYSDGSPIQASEIATITYYVGNYDLESNYTIDSNGVIKYTGTELSTLIVPTTISGRQVKAIGTYAFKNAITQNVTLPTSVTAINDYAFANNVYLTTIAGGSSSNLTIGAYAFRKCTGLHDVALNMTSIGDNAFAYAAITTLSLPSVTTIGKNAFSASSLQTVYIGKNVTSINSTQSSISSLEKVYGYAGTVAETFADNCSAIFVDLTLKINTDFGSKKVIKHGDALSISLDVNGYDLSISNFVSTTNLLSSRYGAVLTQKSANNYVYTITLKNTVATGTYNIEVKITDNFGSTVTSTKTIIYVVSSGTPYGFDASAGQYDVYVDDYKVDVDSFKFYSGYTYAVKVEAFDGYQITNLSIDGTSASDGTTVSVSSPTTDVVISLSSAELSELAVNFSIANGKIKVGDEYLTGCYVDRNESLTFEVVCDTGYYVKRVLVNGEVLEGTDGVYTIDDITTNQNVEVSLESAYFNIDITYVSACGGIVGNLNNIAYGTKNIVITITAEDGYQIDFVTVNGKEVAVSNGTFKIDEMTENKDVIISFKSKGKSILNGDNPLILNYFLVFISIFVMFVVARVILYFVRKKKAKKD